MAKGYPDFYGFSIFPRHGPTYQDLLWNHAVGAGDTDTIHEITSKGRCVGGTMYLAPFGDWSEATVHYYIDGVLISANATIEQLSVNYGEGFSELPFRLTVYCGNGGLVRIEYVKDLAWNDSLIVTVWNASAGNLWINSYFNYTNLE